jgi:hypothetical protein
MELLLQEIRMSSNRRLKQGRAKDEKAARTIRSTGKRGKRARAEELSPSDSPAGRGWPVDLALG